MKSKPTLAVGLAVIAVLGIGLSEARAVSTAVDLELSLDLKMTQPAAADDTVWNYYAEGASVDRLLVSMRRAGSRISSRTVVFVAPGPPKLPGPTGSSLPARGQWSQSRFRRCRERG